MQDLVDILQSEHHQLDDLHYRLTILTLVLDGGDARHVRRAAVDTEAARQRLREVDLLRATAVLRHLAPDQLDGAAPTVRELADRAAHPWPGILRDLHEVLTEAVSEVEVAGFHAAERARTAIHELACADARATEAGTPANAGPTNPARPADACGSRLPTTWRRPPFDDTSHPDDEDLAPLAEERALQDALLAAGRLRVPSLLAFLR